jgi:exodeoxyribonuclease VII large subunit
MLKRRQEKLDGSQVEFLNAATHALEGQETRIAGLSSLLQVLGPGSILNRGFSITFGPDGEILKSTDEISAGDELTTQVSDGKIKSVALE